MYASMFNMSVVWSAGGGKAASNRGLQLENNEFIYFNFIYRYLSSKPRMG